MLFKASTLKHLRPLAPALLLILGTLSSSGARAEPCQGHVYNVEVFRDGNLMVRMVGESTSINRGILCNVNHQVGNAPPTACRQWYSTLLAAYLSGREAVIWLAGNHTCNVPDTAVLVNDADSVWMP